jgi:hypothetical protein
MSESEPLVVPAPATEATAASSPLCIRTGIADLPSDLFYRVRNEYIEVPGLRLTVDQAQRFWQLRRSDCEAVLALLVNAGFLERTRTNAFVRAGSGRAGG